MSTKYAYSKVKTRLIYGGVTLEDAVKVMDYYVSNFDSDKFNEHGVFEFFAVRMTADIDGDEYHSDYVGTYTVEFRGYNYGGDADSAAKPWSGTMEQLENLRKLIKDELGIE